MIEVTLAEAEETLELLVEGALGGEEVFIVSEDDRKRIVRIEAVAPKEAQRRPLGLFKGVFEVGPEFFEPLPDEELRLWNCEGDEGKRAIKQSSPRPLDLVAPSGKLAA